MLYIIVVVACFFYKVFITNKHIHTYSHNTNIHTNYFKYIHIYNLFNLQTNESVGQVIRSESAVHVNRRPSKKFKKMFQLIKCNNAFGIFCKARLSLTSKAKQKF